MVSRSFGRWPATAAVVALLLVGSVAAVVWQAGPAAAAAPLVTVKPSSASYATGQTVSLSVGANSLFSPHSRIIIIECADPGGTSAALPTSINTCDENTAQADTVLVQANGSFSEPSYTLYALPNITLGEQANWQPVCNPTHQCVLYVGEDQDDFTKPKVFSQPFAFTSTAPTLAGGLANRGNGKSGSATQTAPTASASASVSVAPATLAFTGASESTPWLAVFGAALAGLGILGRRTMKRRAK
jgi:hypothetical protein